MERAYQLLGILQSYAPNASAQVKCTQIYNEAMAGGQHRATLVMVEALHDGLKFGNWPWTI